MRADPVLDIFHLSRIGATAEHDGHRLHSHIARPAGHGVRLSSHCEGEALTFWIPESDWCAWLAPQLAVPSADDIADELRSLLASWTLAPLHDFLQAQGLPGCSPAGAEAASAPDGDYWRITVETGGQRLPLYLVDAPADWRRSLLAAFAPSPDATHDLALGLGWCLVPEESWPKVCVGDALPLHGMADALDRLWLHPAATPGRIQMVEANHAVVDEVSVDPIEAPPGTLCLAVEAARTRMTADELARWEPGHQLMLQAGALPVLQLTTRNGLVASGQLIRLEDGWAVRICARSHMLDQ